jgi:hypothetical protein
MKLIQCSACRRPLEPEAFQRNKRGKFGRHQRCRACEKQRDHERIASGKLALAPRLWKVRSPERAVAQSAVDAALRRGELVRKPCAVCGEVRAEAHHQYYSQPLHVLWLWLWLCRRHHAEGHRMELLYGIGQPFFLSLLGEAQQ